MRNLHDDIASILIDDRTVRDTIEATRR